MVETLPHESYMVKVYGSRQATQRSRRFLRKVTPYKPAIPVTEEELSDSKMTRSQTKSCQGNTAVIPDTVITAPY